MGACDTHAHSYWVQGSCISAGQLHQQPAAAALGGRSNRGLAPTCRGRHGCGGVVWCCTHIQTAWHAALVSIRQGAALTRA